MRGLTDQQKLKEFMRALGSAARAEANVYFTGGVCAVLMGFHHFDFHSQALTKIERGHVQDLEDVRSMMRAGLVEGAELRRLHDAIVPQLYRYPAVDPDSLRRSLEAALAPS